MKHFPADWQGFLEEVSLWGHLSIPARRTFLDGVRPHLNIDASSDDPAVDELREAGLLSDSDNADYLSVSPRFIRFHQLAKALERIAVFEAAGFDVLRDYLSEHFTQSERSLLHESLAFHPDDFGRIASLVTTVEWIEDFRARDRTLRPDREAGQSHVRSLETARKILSFFMEQRDHVPIHDLEEYFPDTGRPLLASALKLGVQAAVFFLSIRKTDLEPIVGVWPSAARRIRRAQIALAPEAVIPQKRFRHPFLIEDMATVLLAARAEAIPVRRSDEKPFSRFEEEQTAALLSLPAWLEESSGATPRIRVGSALAALRYCGLLVSDQEGDALRLRPGDGAVEWALGGLGERLEGFLKRAAPGAKGGKSGEHQASRPTVLLSLLLGPWASWAEAAADILPPLTQAFLSAPRSSFIRFKDFARYQAAIANPLIPLRERGGGTSLWAGLPSLPTDELLEDLWQSFLHAYLVFGLFALGGAEAGFASGQPCFLLGSMGRYLLEAAEGFDPDEAASQRHDGETGDIVVQPTFEIAFLSPSPAAEAEIARFAERLGREVGVLFRITKASILRAAAAGLAEGRVIGVLARLSKNPLPPNVEHEVRGWFGRA